MCLQSINKIHTKNDKVYTGYKILRKYPNTKTYHSLLYHKHARGYNLNKWYKNTNPQTIDLEYTGYYNASSIECSMNSYESGFHIFTDLDQAIEYLYGEGGSMGVLVQVQYKQRTCSGVDGTGYDCDVAQYIKIIKEIHPIMEYELNLEVESPNVFLKGYLPKIKDDLKVVVYYKGKKLQELDVDVDRVW